MQAFCTPLLPFLGKYSYTLCTGGHLEPAPSLTKKYYCTSWYIYIYTLFIHKVNTGHALPLQFNKHHPHVLNIPAMDAKSYARALLDVSFRKEEQSRGLVYTKWPACTLVWTRTGTTSCLVGYKCAWWCISQNTPIRIVFVFCLLYTKYVKQCYGGRTVKDEIYRYSIVVMSDHCSAHLTSGPDTLTLTFCVNCMSSVSVHISHVLL